MDYEKAYKQLVEDFGIILNLNTVKESGVISVEDVRKLIPELAESEDERIKTFLHHTFTAQYLCKDKLGKWHGEPVVNILSWLEKQGEQKLVDKIEPKFKVGDWIVENEPNNYARFIQILEVVNAYGKERYKISRDLHNDEDVVEYRFIENNYHSFTIQDAKDGDILCTYECDEPKIVFILKGTPKKPYVLGYHCFYNIMYPSFKTDDEKGCLAPKAEDIKPATKEQRDLLFQKMKEAGYEWDADKKELRKIEDGSAWSEEDEKMLNQVIEDIVKLAGPYVCYHKDVDWLKSLKDRVGCEANCATKQQWKPSEEHIHWLVWAINRMPDTEIANDAEAELSDLLEQLNKLREE